MRCQSKEECAALVRLLPSTEAALLDWAINLMADVVQQEHVNKMNARNIAMVFAPKMTQMADPLTALMYAVQVMNFLKTLILRTLRQREDSVLEQTPPSRVEPFDENGHQSLSQSFAEDAEDDFGKIKQQFIAEAPAVEGSCNFSPDKVITDGEGCGSNTLVVKVGSGRDQMCEAATQADTLINEQESGRVADSKAKVQGSPGKSRAGQSSNSNMKKGPSKQLPGHHLALPSEKTLGISNFSRIDSRTERIETWR